MHMRAFIALTDFVFACMYADPGRVDHRGRASRVFQEIGTQSGTYGLQIRLLYSNRMGSEGDTI
jgi:hypothetical protein